MNSFPLVSIIIPTYNREHLLAETLQSLKNQTYANWECIVVDDGSTDETEKLVNSVIENENRIHFLKRDRQPKGAPTCRNTGFKKSKGDYVLFLDSDDLITDFCLERRVLLFEKYQNYDFLVFPSVLINTEKENKCFLWNIGTEESDLQRFLRLDAIWPICGPIYKREVLKIVNGFDETLDFWQDYDLHLRVLLLQFRYRKFLDLSPDIYIRRHNKESISQAIPFATDQSILKKRIEIYLAIVSFIKERDITINKTQTKTLWGTLLYFSSSFLVLHNNNKEFLKYWNQTNKALRIKFFPQLFSSILAYIMYCRRYSIYFIKLGNIYRSLFKSYIANTDVMKKTNAGTEEFNEAHHSILTLLHSECCR